MNIIEPKHCIESRVIVEPLGRQNRHKNEKEEKETIERWLRLLTPRIPKTIVLASRILKKTWRLVKSGTPILLSKFLRRPYLPFARQPLYT